MTASRTGLAYASLTILIWASFIPISRWGGSAGLTAYDVTALRVGTAALVLLPWWLPRLLRPQLCRLAWYQSAAFAGLAGLAYPLLTYSGFARAPGSHGAILISGLLPLFTTLAASMLLGEKVPRERWLGMGLIVVGLVVTLSANPPNATTAAGDALFLAASITWALFSALLKRWQVRAFDVTLGVVCIAALVYLPVYATALPKHINDVPFTYVIGVAGFQGVIVVCVAMWTYGKSVEALGPSLMALLMSMVPALGTLLSVLLLHEPWTVAIAVGLVCVTGGSLLGASSRPANFPQSV